MRVLDLPPGTEIYRCDELHSIVIGPDKDRMRFKNVIGIQSFRYGDADDTDDWDKDWTLKFPKPTLFKTLYDKLKD